MANLLGILIDIPSITLILLLLAGGFVMWSAQRKENFDFSDMLKDESGKASSMRLGVLVCIAVSSWALIKITMTVKEPEQVFNYYMAYMAIWSGAKIVDKLLDVLIAKFSK